MQNRHLLSPVALQEVHRDFVLSSRHFGGHGAFHHDCASYSDTLLALNLLALSFNNAKWVFFIRDGVNFFAMVHAVKLSCPSLCGAHRCSSSATA